MKIAMVWHCRYPWDVRLEKLSRAASAAGNEPLLVTRGGFELQDEDARGGVRNRRVYIRAGGLGKRVSDLLSVPLFLNPFWMYRLTRILAAERVEMIVVRDLPLAFPLGILSKYLNVPVILDMAENYPAALKEYRNPLYRPFLFGDALLPRLYERASLQFIDHVIVVAEEQRRRIASMGYPPENISIVGNTPDCAALERLAGEDIDEEDRGTDYILYSGFMDRHRGIRTLVTAFGEIAARFPDLRLVLIGRGNESDELRELVRRSGLDGRVRFKGWMDARRIPAYIRNSRACVIPHLRSEHTDTTLPNKLFDYLLFGKPVVVSDAAPLRRVAGEASSALVFRSGDAVGLARMLSGVIDGTEARWDGGAGRDLVLRKYNWSRDERVFAGLLDAGRWTDQGRDGLRAGTPRQGPERG